MTFRPEQFTPTQCTSAAQKAKFANHCIKFVRGGFRAEDFPDWFYRELSNTFGHIAHYDRGGFFVEWFTEPERQLAWVKNALEYPCYGQPAFTHCDVEKLVQTWLRKNNIAGILAGAATRELERIELAELARLQAKYQPRMARAA